jgi:D-3-phosphoglycerate dehydrogenase / 2-oxoglutarate reductase
MSHQSRPKILMAFSQRVHDSYLPPAAVERLETFADWDWFPCEGGGIYDTNQDPEAATRLQGVIGDYQGIIVCHGAPTLTASILDAAPNLRIIGELEGDRFASRIDLDAAWARNIRTVDTTNASSYPVSEWALALILIATRNAGYHFRRMIAGETPADRTVYTTMPGLLTGKRVGIIGGGHMARRLIRFLRPFDVDIWVHDPYLPREMAEAVGFTQTSLDNVMGRCDVVVSMVPLTPATRGMIGARELALLRPRTVFVNVSRGPVVDSAALIARLKEGDICAGLDVFDPEPVPADSEILGLPNVFLTPHIGWSTGDPYRPFLPLMVDELERFFQGHETWYDLTPNTKANRTGAARG